MSHVRSDFACFTDDPFLWLEEIQSDEVVEWVKARNRVSRSVLQTYPEFSSSRRRLQSILDAPNRIPYAYRIGDHFFNFWQDAEHPRGQWRRTRLDNYLNGEPIWEVILDLDELALSEGENWVWAGEHSLGGSYTRSLVTLSRGGGDAVVIREFDIDLGQFISDGYFLPEAKSTVTWVDVNRVLVGTDMGQGSLTDSGYPRTIRLWHRGEKIEESQIVFEGTSTDLMVNAQIDHSSDSELIVLERAVDFYSSQVFLWTKSGEHRKINKPDNSEVRFWRNHIFISLRSDWSPTGVNENEVWSSGSLLVGRINDLLNENFELTALFTPSPTSTLAGYEFTRNHVLIHVTDDVVGHLFCCSYIDGVWQTKKVTTPSGGALSVEALYDPLVVNDKWEDGYFLHYSEFLTPNTIYIGIANGPSLHLIKSDLDYFDSSIFSVEQYFATSSDGTRVPYFLIGPRERKKHGNYPLLLTGYGGFEVSQQPWYLADFGPEWLEKGGVLAVANVRGGGEYGPRWHQAAVGQNRQRSFNDFIAVAEDILAKGVTSPQHLGIMGGSNGGLLVAVAMVQRPELFKAVLCQVPLLDMLRFHQLAAGASWIAEFGDPDEIDDFAALLRYSPYHNVIPDAHYPAMFLVSSTLDDRVHPAHARKMAAKMLAQGHQVLYYETFEGGHGVPANHEQAADRMALEFSFLWQQLR